MSRLCPWYPPALRPAALAVAFAALLAPVASPPARAGGFAVPDQGARAAAAGSAFAARADDASAIFHNPGGLALPGMDGKAPAKTRVLAGANYSVLEESLYQGLPPGIGAGTTGEQTQPVTLTPHAYLARQISPRIAVGLGAYSPYAFTTEWDPAGFPGRFQTLDAQLVTYDLAPTLSAAVLPNLGIGVSAIYRLSTLDHSRRLGGVDPQGSPATILDYGLLEAETDTEGGFGFSAGLLHRATDHFSWGLTYRSSIEIDYVGTATATQISTGDPLLDELFASVTPFGEAQLLTTSLELPETASLGLALTLGRSFVLAADVGWTGWSSVQAFDLRVPSEPQLGTLVVEDLEDSFSYRTGLTWKRPSGAEVSFGLGYEETPQPDLTVGPLFVDADRLVVSLGYSRDWLHLYGQYQDYDQRIITVSGNDFTGNYRNQAFQVGVTVGR